MEGMLAGPGEGMEEIWPCSGVIGCCGCRGICVGGSERDGPIADWYAVMGVDKNSGCK